MKAPEKHVYQVGGSVRDELLELPVHDRDWVVVGATPELMQQEGFVPVGKDFPVFLHPETREEYALARTERKSGKGYKGFTVYASPTVTLAEDLARRDLTINAMAKDQGGRLIDPYGGLSDLRQGILRHVSDAFAEDPLRVLRVARFKARFPHFTIAGETLALMQQMALSGELEDLVPERVWQELARGLMEKNPSEMFLTLRLCHALRVILPEVDRLFGVPQNPAYHPEIDTGIHVMMVIDVAAVMNSNLPIRFAALVHDLGKGLTPAWILPGHKGHEKRGAGLVPPLCARLRIPADCRELGIMAARFHGIIHKGAKLSPKAILRVLELTDAFRRKTRFLALLEVARADSRGRQGYEAEPYPQQDFWKKALSVALAVDPGAIAKGQQDGQAIRKAIHKARLQRLQSLQQNQSGL
jgi:tRNA nucleotidyltransferase (CCA-adding enzyme)